ncbi:MULTISPECIES: sensor histidine kinase [Streptomyces]|uniref:sensor histidine kinase n=1 Tax=Streptomyces TaxID=1883 RepID=UPI00073E072E|nr:MULTISPECIES: sensor histidine kinase [unclassified Streptomyces]OYP16764.1 sensor histidine kinase [Streptomyces sp. FBKL.4005]BCM67806.1 putative two-component system sensor kinase [Streptomyces sp. EAS-AB2608]CUW29371.1 Sensor histidine kinase LiaS [Streptomyces reticuli]
MPNVDLVTPADPSPSPAPAEGRQLPADGTAPLRRRLRAWLGEAPTRNTPPFSRHRWARLLTYLLIGWTALAIALAGGADLTGSYDLAHPVALLATSLQAVAIVLAVRRPVPAWLLSLAAAAVTALLARPHLETVRPPGPNWPWSTPVLLAHMAVLLLFALRIRFRGTIAVLLVTALVTYVLEAGMDTGHYSGTGTIAVALFAIATSVGGTLRSRQEARSELVQQTTITAEERARRTLLEERSRIARELHDVVAHHMSVISIQAQVAPHLVKDPSDELLENLAGIRGNALEALTELRRVLGVLRSENPENPEDPYGLGGPGTGAAPDAPQPTLARLDALIENTRAAGLDVTAEVVGEVRPYAPGVELSAYRIVQEALSNALRHAPGSTVHVEVGHFPNGLHLVVANSAPRYPVPPSPGAGHGLLGMRERAAMLGGHVTAERTSGGGFSVTAFLPGDIAPAPSDQSPTGEQTP